MKIIHVEFSNERLITPSGLVFVGQILGKSDFVKKINRAPISNEYLQKQIKNGDILLTYIGMLCQGKPQYEAVREMMDDPDYYKYALGVSYAIPSAETLRQRFDMIGDSLRKDILQANVDMLREMKIEPSALDNGYVPVDIDVTPFDNSKTHKEGVSRTYKGFDGYAPIMAYIGTEGYCVNTELRIGRQHCQKETPDFLRETISLCRKLTDKPLLIRLDSGNDASENIGIFMEAVHQRMVLAPAGRSKHNPAILKLWSKQFADVSTKSYMRGYRDIYSKVNAFHKLMIRFCDNLVNMVIVKITFGEDKA